MQTTEPRFTNLASRFDKEKFRQQNEQMCFSDYYERVLENPNLLRSSHQRLYDMIIEKGTETFERCCRTITRYKFFSEHSKQPVYGIEEPLESLVKAFHGAARYYGVEKRIILLHGPVGSSKSTICSAIKKGLEEYTNNDNGKIYTYAWKDLNVVPGLYLKDVCPAALNENPLCLLPTEMREKVEAEINAAAQIKYQKDLHEAKRNDPECDPTKVVNEPYKFRFRQELNPRCQFFMDELLNHYDGDLKKVIDNHIVVKRFFFSERRRVGIGTFQPKDEKNQDNTELTGDIDYQALQFYGKDSDPRAFSYDGEFLRANGGFFEVIEMLKLAREFLYDFLGAAQEQQVKPKKFGQLSIDEVLIGHTNLPDFEKLLKDRGMEALRDRTVKIDIPYLKRWSDEVKVLLKDYGPEKVGIHIAPHTLQMAALWAILTRLTDDGETKISLVDKAKLYDGRHVEGFNEERAQEMMGKHPKEGMDRGMSARYTQNKIGSILVKNEKYISFFMLLNEIEEGLGSCTLIDKEEDKEYYLHCAKLVKEEFEDVAKNEVRRAMTHDGDIIQRLCTNYIDNLFAFVNNTKVKNKITQKMVESNERLMRSIEEKIGISEGQINDFRRTIAANIGDLGNRGEKFHWNSNARLQKALELKLFDDVRDTIKISKLGDAADTVDPEMQAKIDVIKYRLIKDYGYNEESATDILEFVGGLWSQSDPAE